MELLCICLSVQCPFEVDLSFNFKIAHCARKFSGAIWWWSWWCLASQRFLIKVPSGIFIKEKVTSYSDDDKIATIYYDILARRGNKRGQLTRDPFLCIVYGQRLLRSWHLYQCLKNLTIIQPKMSHNGATTFWIGIFRHIFKWIRTWTTKRNGSETQSKLIGNRSKWKLQMCFEI